VLAELKELVFSFLCILILTLLASISKKNFLTYISSSFVVDYRYASEVDVEFVRKSVRTIGRLAIKITTSADICISVLLSLVSTKISYVVQEAIVVIKDIFRRYPNQYEGIIGTLCENLDALENPDAKAAMIWILGQYADRIENSEELLDDFLQGFLEETVEVKSFYLLSLSRKKE